MSFTSGSLTPAIVAALLDFLQAKQTLGGQYGVKSSGVAVPLLPGMYDGEESASIAQRSDRMLSVWMPYKSYPLGTSISLGDGHDPLIVEEDLLMVKVVKQRGMLPSGKSWLFKVAFEVGEMENVPL